jgi:hypothetical protein
MQFGAIEIPDMLVYLVVGGTAFWYVALRKPKSIKKLRREDTRLNLEMSIAAKKRKIRAMREEDAKKHNTGW